MNPRTIARLQTALRWALGLLMLWASVSKLANPSEFLGSIYAYELPLSPALLKLAAVILPWVELLCALLLLANHWTDSALWCCLALLVVFIAATGQAWARGLNIACGCFDLAFLGQGPGAVAVRHFLESVGFAFFRNGLLAGAVLWLLGVQAAASTDGSGAESRPVAVPGSPHPRETAGASRRAPRRR